MSSYSQSVLGHVTNWLQRHKFTLSAEAIFKRSVLEGFAMSFILMASLSVYMYGVFWILPFVFSDESVGIQSIAFVAACWCLFGIWANLFLVRYRDPSIRHRVLSQPVIVAEANLDTTCNMNPYLLPGEGNPVRDRRLSESDQIKNLGQQFMISPFGSETAWHICGVCEVYVPPRSWHCHICNTCILRRCHHCVFAMTCIGEDNHINFLGLLMYLSIGATYSTIIGMIYVFYQFEISPLWFILRSLFSWYVIIFDFSIMNVLSTVTFLGGISSWSVLIYYLILALKNQTSADHSRGVKRSISVGYQYSYANLKTFLGPNPVLRILWPFSSILKTDYRNGSNGTRIGSAGVRSAQLDFSKTV